MHVDGRLLHGRAPIFSASAAPLLVINMLVTTDFNAWYGSSSLVAVIMVVALAPLAFRASLGGQPLWTGPA